MGETQLAVRVIIFSCGKGWRVRMSTLNETGIVEDAFPGAHSNGDASSTPHISQQLCEDHSANGRCSVDFIGSHLHLVAFKGH